MGMVRQFIHDRLNKKAQEREVNAFQCISHLQLYPLWMKEWDTENESIQKMCMPCPIWQVNMNIKWCLQFNQSLKLSMRERCVCSHLSYFTVRPKTIILSKRSVWSCLFQLYNWIWAWFPEKCLISPVSFIQMN